MEGPGEPGPAGPAPAPAGKSTRQGLSLSERIQVIEARQVGKSMRQLAAQFNCGKTQILNTLAQKDRYLHEWELLGGRNNPSAGARKRFRHTRNEQINRSVHEWYQQQTADGLRITGPMLQRQARQYAGQLGINNFAASNGWLANFRRFYNICSANSRKSLQKTSPVKGEEEAGTSSAALTSVSESEPVVNSSDEAAKLSNSSTEAEVIVHDHIQPTSASVSNGKERLSLPPVKEATASFSSMSVSNSQEVSSDNSYLNKEGTPNQNISSTSIIQAPSSSIINHHRKRRLLVGFATPYKDQGPPPVAVVNNQNTMTAQLIVPETLPSKAHFSEFLSLSRSKGLITLIVKDEEGNDWIEIRSPMATYIVPRHNYPTHLSRLIVDSSLHYYLEVLGQCIQQGSLYKGHRLDYSEVETILSALNGGYVVCAGIERHLNGDLMTSANEFCSSENLYVTYPDLRFRSHQCSKWIDRRRGPSCLACQSSGFYNNPIDLRCHEH